MTIVLLNICQDKPSIHHHKIYFLEQQEFENYLRLATDQAKEFAQNFINEALPVENVYMLQLNSSLDDRMLTQFDTYPEDEGKVINNADIFQVTQLLLRKTKVPVWIDISVSGVLGHTTVLTLICAGRYTGIINEMYYHSRGLGPFGVKSPVFPANYIEGSKFNISETMKHTL